MVTHFSILVWEIPWTEEPDRLQSIGSKRVRHHWVIKQQHIYVYICICVCVYIYVCVCVCVHILFNLFLWRILANAQLNFPWQTFPKCSHRSNAPECSEKCPRGLQVKTYSHLQVNQLQWKHVIKDLQNPGTIGIHWQGHSQGLEDIVPKTGPHAKVRWAPYSFPTQTTSEVSRGWDGVWFLLCSPPSFSVLTVQSGYTLPSPLTNAETLFHPTLFPLQSISVSLSMGPFPSASKRGWCLHLKIKLPFCLYFPLQVHLHFSASLHREIF